MVHVSKLRGLGFWNQILNDLDSDDEKFGQGLWSDLDSEVEIRFRIIDDANF